MKKLIKTKGTEFEQNGKDLAIIDTSSRASIPIMVDSHVLDEAIRNGEPQALEMISMDVDETWFQAEVIDNTLVLSNGNVNEGVLEL